MFNSFDRYDYIGNPELKNEKSTEGNAFFGYKNNKIKAKITTSYFHISDYIVGKPDVTLIPMTIGASGIKVYTALDYATIFNTDLNVAYQFSDSFKWSGQLLYSYGKDNQKVNLPFISPLRYSSTLYYKKNKFSFELAVQGNAVQTQYSPFYGEDRTPDYAILNMSSGYSFAFEKTKTKARSKQNEKMHEQPCLNLEC